MDEPLLINYGPASSFKRYLKYMNDNSFKFGVTLGVLSFGLDTAIAFLFYKFARSDIKHGLAVVVGNDIIYKK